MDPADITEDLFAQYLYSAGVPDPELVIRPSGEMRLSNFLPCGRRSIRNLCYERTLAGFTPTDLDEAIANSPAHPPVWRR